VVFIKVLRCIQPGLMMNEFILSDTLFIGKQIYKFLSLPLFKRAM